MLSVLLPFLTSFALSALLTPLVIRAAWQLGWVAKPRTDRWHSRPTALMGGIAIFAGTALSWWLTGDHQVLMPVALPAAAMFLLGFIDDRVEFRPHQKLMAQVIVGSVLITSGIVFGGMPALIAVPLTLLWLVGITNAVNLLDNMDGLAAGVSAISALILGAYCAMEGTPATATAAFALAGGCAGFLIYNFSPARVFMGDCGSLFIGLSLASLAVQGTHRSAPSLLVSLMVPVAVLAIPIFDTTLVAVARALHGRPILPGFRDHTSHRMMTLGLSERATALIFYLLTALFGLLALLTTRLPMLEVISLALFLLAGLTVLGLYLGFLKVYDQPGEVPATVRLLSRELLFKRQLLQVILDVQLIPACFVGAHLLRFEGVLAANVKHALLMALPLVLLTKLAALSACRSYRGVWRFAGMTDALNAAAGSTAGSAALAILLSFLAQFRDLSRAALIMDWVLFTLLAVASRTGYVALRQLFGMLPPKDGARVLILGTGVEAQALCHKLRDPLSPRRALVLGIVDDDPNKKGRHLNGVPVIGTVEDLPGLIEKYHVDYCLLGVSPYTDEGADILACCGEKKIPVCTDLGTPAILPAGAFIRVA